MYPSWHQRRHAGRGVRATVGPVYGPFNEGLGWRTGTPLTERYAIDIGGSTIRRGTSVYDTVSDRVMWFYAVHGGYVELETPRGDKRMTRSDFEARIEENSIVVEAEPLVAPD